MNEENYSGIICLFFNPAYSFAQEEETLPPLNPAQLGKGEICGIRIGDHLPELLYMDIDAKADGYIVEGDFYIKYHLDIFDCGEVTVHVNDKNDISLIFTELTDYTTKEGARVGMTLTELQEIYPTAILHNGLKSLDRMDRYFYSLVLPDGLGTFIIDVSSIISKCGDKFPECDEHIMDLKSIDFFTY